MRIILGDPHPQALWALKTTLQEKSEFEVIGVVETAQDLLAQIAETPTDLILIDWELPGKTIDDLIAELHSNTPKPIVVVMGNRPEHGRMLLKAGADAFVSKGDQPDWLFETLKKFEIKLREKEKISESKSVK
jgi:two-component system, NarL family, response regulator DesR